MNLRYVCVPIILPLLTLANESSWTPQGSVGVDLANAYIFRGATAVDSPVAQPSVQLQPWPGLFLGMWGNIALDSDHGRYPEREFTEVDLSVSYSLPFDALPVSVGWVEYLYPHADSGPDREVSLSVAPNLPLSPSLTAFWGVDGVVRHELYTEGSLAHEWAWFDEQLRVRMTGTLAWRYSPERATGFSHAALGLTIPYRFLALSTLWMIPIDDRVLPDDVFDRPLLFTLSFRANF